MWSMKVGQDARRGLVVALGFAAFIAAVLLVAYLVRDLPSPEQVCIQKCALLKKDGHLVHKGPATPKDFYKQANSVCECQ